MNGDANTLEINELKLLWAVAHINYSLDFFSSFRLENNSLPLANGRPTASFSAL